MKVKMYRVLLMKGTTGILYVPSYEIPLLRALWAAEGVQIKVTDIPSDSKIASTTREIESVSQERNKLLERYLTHPRTKGPLFDIVYPGGAFDTAVRNAVAEARTDAPAPDVLEDPAELDREVVIASFMRLEGIGRTIAAGLLDAGYESIEAIAAASPGALEKISGIGRSRAPDVVSAALSFLHGAPEAGIDEADTTDEGGQTVLSMSESGDAVSE